MDPQDNYVAALERSVKELTARVAALEADRDRFLEALKGAARMCLEQPMVAAMMPKHVKEAIRQYVA